MFGFLGGVGVALVSRLLGGVVLLALAVGAYWYFTRTPTDEPIPYKRELGWKEDHLRRRIVGAAVDAILAEAPTPGTRNSILLAPFAGDNDALAVRNSVYNALLSRGYNHGEVRRLARTVGLTADSAPAAPTRSDPSLFQRLKNAIGLGEEPDAEIKQDEPADSLCYVEGSLGHDLKAEAPSVSLELSVAPVIRKDGKWQRKEETVPLTSAAFQLTPGTAEYWKVWMQSTGGWARLFTWLGIVAALPWLLALLVKKVVELENNAAAAAVLIGFTAVGAASAWALQGMGPDGTMGWVVLGIATVAAGLYNFAVCEWMASRFEA
jgi:hypothetical protein